MGATQLSFVLAGVTNLALGLVFLYLWRVLPRGYVLLLALARLLTVPDAAVGLWLFTHPDDRALTLLAATLSAASAMCGVTGLLYLLGRKPRAWPFAALATALIVWGAVGPQVTDAFALRYLPDPAIRGGFSLWIAWLLFRGPRLPARRPLAVLLLLQGLHSFDYPLLGNKAWGLTVGLGLAQFLNLAISGFLFITLLDEARRVAQQAGAALSKSEEKFAIAFRSSPLPSLITRLDDGLMIDVNDAFCTATGYAREDVIGRSTKDVIWPEPARRATMVALLRADGRVKNLELKMRTKTGTPLDVLASLEVIELDGVPHTLGAVIDVTQQNLAIAALRDSEERFRRLVQDLSVGVAVIDGTGRVLLCNRAGRDMLGVSEAQVLSEGFWQRELVPLREDGTAYAEDERPVRVAVRTGRAVHNQVLAYHRFASGERAWALFNADPQLDAEGRVRNVIVTFSDITERRKAEDEQRRLQDAVMASAVDWTLTFDAVESPILILDGDGRVRRLNAAARGLAGLDTYQQGIGRPIGSLGSGEPWRGLSDLSVSVHRSGVPATSQVREDRAHRSWYLTAGPFTVSGEQDRIIVIARDVTDLVHLEESLRRTETMSALGSLVAGVAHEVRNPLFAISATVDAFEARFGTQEGYARYTSTLRQEVTRLSGLMHDLLDYGKPPTLDLAETALGPVVARAVAACADIAAAGGVTVATDVPDTLPTVRLDASRMQQVFHNLIANAVQHSPKGGVVRVGAAVTRGEAAPYVEVRIEDQGPGFREDDLPHIFEPFFTRRRGGTGLGLSIVQRIVEQHNGAVVARNRPEGGAFTAVRLTIAGDRTQEAPETARAQA
ncbi:MAG TPA: PAS domain S-box protein [Gemmatimonadales bacterium]|nr:PAS domain S-box protein [Gemmatimonadales bacterium]